MVTTSSSIKTVMLVGESRAVTAPASHWVWKRLQLESKLIYEILLIHMHKPRDTFVYVVRLNEGSFASPCHGV